MPKLTGRASLYVHDAAYVMLSNFEHLCGIALGKTSRDKGSDSNDGFVREFMRTAEFGCHVVHVGVVTALKQVRWVAAKWVVAAMANIKRSRSIGQLPRDPVRSTYPALHLDSSVPANSVSGPRPARHCVAHGDPRPKPFGKVLTRVHRSEGVPLQIDGGFTSNLAPFQVGPCIRFCSATAATSA